VCATPRSGSTLLCALLTGTGVAGRPEEYFECLWRSGAPRQPREFAQAVSLWRAVQTLAWRADDAREPGEVVYHGGAIGHLVAELTEQDEAWRAWFAANGIEPLTIAYEALVDDGTAAVESVLEHVGAGRAEIPEPPLRRQGDDRSARWVERFRSEREAVAR
jgi:LPS sulfotransferase NodH